MTPGAGRRRALVVLAVLMGACGGREPAPVAEEGVADALAEAMEEPEAPLAGAAGDQDDDADSAGDGLAEAGSEADALVDAAGEEPGGAQAPTGDAAAIVAAVLTPAADRVLEYDAIVPKSVVAVQMFREVRVVSAGEGGRPSATLTDLNPVVHEWFVLEVKRPGAATQTYHLENANTAHVRLKAAPEYPDGIVVEVDGEPVLCPLWEPDGPRPLELARTSGRAFAPLCGERIALRNPVDGRRSNLEATTDFLRDKVWGGEQITAFVRETVYQDSELVTSEVLPGDGQPEVAEGPVPFRARPEVAGRRLRPVNLGLPLEDAADGTVEIGRWYSLAAFPGVYTSTVQPTLADPALSADWGNRVHPLDDVEATALVYVVAFDLDQHELRYDGGTDHPRVGWSERVRGAVVDTRLPGPDGFDSLAPLVRNGKVNPAQLPQLVSTFTGGFKRSHGAFKSGDRALRDSGSHYGFVEHGVVESKLLPQLATMVQWTDGELDVLMWDRALDTRLAQVVFARQNGVPLIVPDPETGEAVPGDLVTSWMGGNWSGSADGKLRSVRAAVCIQDSDRGRYLLYYYFSSATPSSMARVMAAYGCGVGMLTDMNALEHTYLSLHELSGETYSVHHLINGMNVLDKELNGVYLPRFVGLADNRDFFTVLRKEED